jgi:DnaK suppressor protein
LEAALIDVFFNMLGIGSGKSIQSRADSQSVNLQKSGKSLPDSEGKLSANKAQAATARRQEMKAPAKKSKMVSKATTKPAGKSKSAAKPVAKPASKSEAKKPLVKPKSKAKPMAKVSSKAKATPKPVAKKAVVKAVKPLSKTTSKVAAKPAVKKPVAKPMTKKATAKPIAKSVAKTPVKATAKASNKAPAKVPAKGAVKTATKPVTKTPLKAPAKSASKSAHKPVAKPATKPIAKLPVKTSAKAAEKASAKHLAPAKAPTKPAAAPAAPVKPATPPAPPPKTKAGSRVVPSYAPSAANMSPHGGNTAAKASFTMSAPVLAPPPQLVVKKDPKLAGNWKTKTAEQLSDQEVIAMPDSEYMNAKQLAFFRLKLVALKNGILSNAGETTEHLREDTTVVPDPADRATIEEEHALELRTRDRERKLLKKIEQSIASIDGEEYGYCDETGEPIGVARLIARPTATLSIEAQQRRELKQKMFGD